MPPRSDGELLDDVYADALAYGGDNLVADVRAEASAWALEHDDPARWSAYLAVAWQIVDAHRAERVGEMVPMPNGRWRTVTPARCPAGHSWDYQRSSPWVASWLPCRGGHSGHHRWLCLVEDEAGAPCREVLLFPEPVEGCSFVGIGEGEG